MAQPDPFAAARDSFLQSLGPKERSMFANCSSTNELLTSAGKLAEDLERKGVASTALKALDSFSKRLGPYFDTIGIFVQTHSEIAGFFWGATRLALQLSTNYANFVVSFTSALEGLAFRLPYLEDDYSALPPMPQGRSSSRLKLSLTEIYTNLFKFLKSIIRIFTRKDGSRAATPIVVGKTFWKPFDARYKDLLERISFHGEIVQKELKILRREHISHREDDSDRMMNVIRQEIQSIERLLEGLNNSRSKPDYDNLFRNIQIWISSPDFARDFQRARNLRAPGTTDWLSINPQFEAWRDLQVPVNSCGLNELARDTILVVKGNAGSGKTILAAATVDQLTKYTNPIKREVYYFFFRAGSPSFECRLDAYCALLLQILRHHRNNQDVLDKMTFAMLQNSTGQFNRPTEEIAFELLVLNTALVVSNGYIILDGVDECTDSYELMSDMRALSRRTGVKILLFARPNLRALYDDIISDTSISITKQCSDAIEVFFDQELKKLEVGGLLPQAYDSQEVLKRLVRRADGMFLWAELMMAYLRIPVLTARRRLSLIMSTADPEGLDAMYDRIATVISNQSAEETNMAKRMIMMLIHASPDLGENDYELALNIGNGIASWDPEDRIRNFRGVVVTTCGGLVEPVFLNSTQGSFQFIHLTTKEYFQAELFHASPQPKESPARRLLSASCSPSHCEIARICLRALVNAAPGRPLHWKDPMRMETRPPHELMPLILYASKCWIGHVVHVTQQQTHQGSKGFEGYSGLIDILNEFFCNRAALTCWIETSYTFRVTPDASRLLEWAQIQLGTFDPSNARDELAVRTLTVAKEFAYELMNLEKIWGDSLRETPSCIWDEIPGFTGSRFWTVCQSTRTTSIAPDAVDDWTPTHISNACLCKISSSVPSGESLAILTIWPSRQYQLATEQSNLPPDIESLDTHCRGWNAQYQRWWVTDRISKLSLNVWISLDPQEVLLQLRQSLQQTRNDLGKLGWSLQFPLAISPSTNRFIVLRTLYDVNQDSVSPIRSCILPMPDRWAWKLDDRHRRKIVAKLKRCFRGMTNPSAAIFRYEYWFSFSTDDQSLGLVDSEAELDGVWTYRSTSGDLGTPFLPMSSPGTSFFPQGVQPKIYFHPSLSIAVAKSQFGGFLRVIVWAIQPVSRCLGRLYNFPKARYDVDITFSQCGEYLVLDTKGKGPPIIRHINDSILQAARQSAQVWRSEDKQSLVPNSSASNTVAMRDMRPASLLSADYALGSGAQIEDQATGRGIVINHTATSLEVHAWTKKEGFSNRNKHQILKLPKTASKDTANVAIDLPKSPSEDLKIIVNVAARPVYTLDGTIDLAAPTIVWRDLQTVLQSENIRHHLLPPNTPAISADPKEIGNEEYYSIFEVEDGADEQLQDDDMAEEAPLVLWSAAMQAGEDNGEGSSEGARKRKRPC